MIKFKVEVKDRLGLEFDELLGKFVEEHSVDGEIPSEVLLAMFETGIKMTTGCKVLLEDRGVPASDLDGEQYVIEKTRRSEAQMNLGFVKALFGR